MLDECLAQLLKEEQLRAGLGLLKQKDVVAVLPIACEQAFSRAGWAEGKAKRPVDRPLGPPFHGTRCASDPDASSYWREH